MPFSDNKSFNHQTINKSPMKVILPKFFYLQLEQPGLLGFGLGVLLAPGLNIMGLCAITLYIFKLKLFFTI